MLIRLRNSSLRSRLSEWLFDAIVRGDLKPGARILEGKLARQLSVAQSTLREALQELEHQGLLTKSERKGTFVTQLTPQDTEDIYVVRLELEPIAAALAHERMAPADYAALAHILEEMRQASERKEYLQIPKLDLMFHQHIWRLSGNSSIERALTAVCPPLFANFMIRMSSGKLYDFTKDYDEHAALLTALKQDGFESVKHAFRSMLETFRIQDVEYLRPTHNGHSFVTSRRKRRSPHTRSKKSAVDI